MYSAIARYYSSLFAEEERKYGESVARMVAAETSMIEALKICEKTPGAPQLL